MITEYKDKTLPVFAAREAAAFSEQGLTDKFSVPARRPSLAYDMTGDAALRHQYGLLCRDSVNRLAGLGIADSRVALSALAKLGRQCVGGIQAALSFPRNAQQLPCEREGFSLQKSLPELDLYNVIYGEVLDFVALPEYQEETAAGLLEHLVSQAAAQGVQYLFMVSGRPQLYSLPGLSWALHQDMALPDYDEFAGGRACLNILDLTMLEASASFSRESLPA